MTKAVFLDTVGLVALWDRGDQWHHQAELAYMQLTAQRACILTTSFVLLECGNTAARRVYRPRVVALKRMLETRGELIEPNLSDCEQA